ncbi:hypothetical protein ABZ671_25310 [Micromonospora sp. NPDC006766]|uniref:hypothetical protein n=1 Tax=Micromonospora sp. NPDC006766 TaxID=3154778 RepID=UPI0033DA6AAA
MVLDGHADLLIAAALDDLPQVEVADTPRPVVPRQRTASDDVVPPGVIPPAGLHADAPQVRHVTYAVSVESPNVSVVP